MKNPAVGITVFEPAGVGRNRDKNRFSNGRSYCPTDSVEKIVHNFSRSGGFIINQLNITKVIPGDMMVNNQHFFAAAFGELEPIFQAGKLHKTIGVNNDNQVDISKFSGKLLFFYVIA